MTPSPNSLKIDDYLQQPDGYVRLAAKEYRAVAREWAAPAVAEALKTGTLHEWSARQPLRKEMRGRGLVFSVELPTSPATAVVIRRNRHGGLLSGVTGELFLAPTRAPYELSMSLRLAVAGIPTPEIIAYATYPVAGIFARSDVMTRRLPEGADLPEAWGSASPTARNEMIVMISQLLNRMEKAGARHADLNLKNIYIAGSGSALSAYLLDLDRVTFPGTGDVADLNFKRLARSARKWRQQWGLDFSEDTLERLAPRTKETG